VPTNFEEGEMARMTLPLL